MDNITIFVNRLKKIGIDVEFMAKTPWIYLTYISGKRVKEKNESEYGFTIGYLHNNGCDFAYLKETFELIRKYI